MTLRLIPDDEDDRMSANPEEPRVATGYDAPRLRARPPGKATRWTFAEVAGAPAAHEAGPIGGARKCKPTTATLPGCGEPSSVLHADPRSASPERTLCSRCTGDVMRARVGDATATAATPAPRGTR